MGYRGDRASDVQGLLDELCVKLGFCLPPGEQHRLAKSPPQDVDSFTDAVLEAEGMGDMSYTSIRRQVRDVVDRHMSRWAKIDQRQRDTEPGEGPR
jgi:hypothetical protein